MRRQPLVLGVAIALSRRRLGDGMVLEEGSMGVQVETEVDKEQAEQDDGGDMRHD